jgi:hypothetical protein
MLSLFGWAFTAAFLAQVTLGLYEAQGILAQAPQPQPPDPLPVQPAPPPEWG